MRKKGAISQAKLLLGQRREKYHSNNGTGDVRRGKQWEDRGRGREEEEGRRSQTKAQLSKSTNMYAEIGKQSDTILP